MATNTANNIFNVNPDVSQPFWKNLTQNVFYPAAYLNQLPTETLAGMALGAPLGILGSDWLVNYINRGKKKTITPKPTFDTNIKYNVNGKPYSLDELRKIYGADNLSPKISPPQNEQLTDAQSVQQQFNWADNAGIPKNKQTAISFLGGKVSREYYDRYTGANWQDRNYTGTDWIGKRPQQGEPLSSYVSRMNFQDNLNNNSLENIIKREAQLHLDKFRQSATPILYPFPKDITLPTTYIPKSREEIMDGIFGNPLKKFESTFKPSLNAEGGTTFLPYNTTYNFNPNRQGRW